MPNTGENSHSGTSSSTTAAATAAPVASAGDDLGSTDEVKVFKDEGDREDEKASSENLLEEKFNLIDLTESAENLVKNSAARQDLSPPYVGPGASSRSVSSPVGGSGGSASGGATGGVTGAVGNSSGKLSDHSPDHSPSGFAAMGGYLPPYQYSSGTASALQAAGSMGKGLGLSQFFCNEDPLSNPPPAHCGILPYQLDSKAIGLTARQSLYSFSTSQYPYPSILSSNMLPVPPSWHTPSMYSTAPSFRNSYPSSLQIYTTLASDLYSRYQSSQSLLNSVHSHASVLNQSLQQQVKQEVAGCGTTAGSTGGVGQDMSHNYSVRQHAHGLSPGSKSVADLPQELTNHRFGRAQSVGSTGSGGGGGIGNGASSGGSSASTGAGGSSKKKCVGERSRDQQQQQQHQQGGHQQNPPQPNRPHIKKPLNAFMLYMKEMRAKVVAECTLKESAAINQILGRKWHSLSRDEQSVYYDKARQERQLHMEMYPGWTARDNYGYGSKKKRKAKKKDQLGGGSEAPSRRKKICIRNEESDNYDGSRMSDEYMGSYGTVV